MKNLLKSQKLFFTKTLILSLLPIFTIAQSPGTLIPSFGVNGKAIIDVLGKDNLGNAIAAKTNGKLVVAGMISTYFVVYQLNDDGSLDKSFNYTGATAVNFGGTGADVSSVCIQTDGKIIIAGSVVDNGISDFGVLRVNTDGSVDSTFGSNGRVIIDNNSRDDRAYAMKLQVKSEDDKIYVSGYSISGGDADYMTVRLNSNGTLDNAFGNGGIAQIDLGSNQDKCFGNYIQADGKILLGGIVDNGGLDFALVRLNTDGSIDNNFGNSGKQITDFKGNDDWGFTIAMQSTGKILLVGYCKNANNNDFAIARYDTSGNIDTQFGNAGKQITPIGLGDDYGRGIWIQNDDKILFAGRYIDGNGKLSVGLLRYTANGSLDNNFGINGIFRRKFGTGGDDYCNDVIMTTNGDILVAGFTTANGGYDVGVMELYSGAVTAINSMANNEDIYNIYPVSKNTIKLESSQLKSSSNKLQISIYTIDGKLIPSIYSYTDNALIIEVPEYYANRLLMVQINNNKSSQTYKIKL